MPPISFEERRKQLALTAAYMANVVGVAAALYAQPLYWKQPYHNSKLSGAAWVEELIVGHPDRIRSELGMSVHVFLMLVEELRFSCQLQDSRHITLKEQVAIFCYTCVTGLSIRHVGERFQRSNKTISLYGTLWRPNYNSISSNCFDRYFRTILDALTSPPFYKKYVQLPDALAPIPSYIAGNQKFTPWFDNVIGAMGGTHITCCPSSDGQQAAQNRKGGVSQNCLACVSFDMKFVYFVSGWEGSTADSTMYTRSQLTDLLIPPGCFYLADAGFGICDLLLVPYCGVRYHLAEWGRADVRYVWYL